MRYQPSNYLLVSLLIIHFSSCTSKVSHEQALEYYVSIQIQVANAHKEFRDYVADQLPIEHDLYTEIISSAKNNVPETINKNQLDSFTARYLIHIERLDSFITEIQHVNEIRDNLNLKFKSIDYLNKTKVLDSLNFKMNSWIYEDRIKNSKGNEATKLIEMTAKNDVDDKRKILMIGLNKFQNKYQIKETELTKYGL